MGTEAVFYQYQIPNGITQTYMRWLLLYLIMYKHYEFKKTSKIF